MKKLFTVSLVMAFLLVATIGYAAILPDNIGPLPITGGKYWFVGSSSAADSDSNPSDAATHSYEFPFSTIDTAINAATAKSATYPGDVIVILPGHADTVDAVTDLVPDKAGLYFYGCGEGDGRPTITISTALAASILISGADCTFENLIFKCTYDDANTVTSQEMIDVGADDITFKRCKFWSSDDGTGDMLQLDGANTADNCKFIDCEFVAASGTVNGISAESAQDGLTIKNCKFFGSYSGAPIYGDEAMTNTVIEGCYIENDAADQYAIELTHTSNTGYLVNNMIYTDDRATAIDCDDMWSFGNKFSMGVDMPPVDIPTDGTTIQPGVIHVYAQGGSTTTIVDEALCAYPNDTFNSGWVAFVTEADNAAPQGETRDVSDFVQATGTVTVGTAYTAAPAAGDHVILIYDSFRAIASDTSDPVDMSPEIPNNSPLANILDDGGATANYDRRKHSLFHLGDIIGYNDNNNDGSTSSVVANKDGSLAERSEAVLQMCGIGYNSPQYLEVDANMAHATWNTAAAHEIAVVTGTVRLQILCECITTLTDGGDSATIQLGSAGNTAGIIAATSAGGSGAANQLDAGEIWIDATPADIYVTQAYGSIDGGTKAQAIHDVIVTAGNDVGYTIANEALTGGMLTFYIWWTPISSDGAVTAGAGGAF